MTKEEKRKRRNEYLKGWREKNRQKLRKYHLDWETKRNCGVSREELDNQIAKKEKEVQHKVSLEYPGSKAVLLNTSRYSYENFCKMYAIVDSEDFEKAKEHSWTARKGKGDTYYAKTTINGKPVRLHTFLMGIIGVDHANGNGLDCRRCNMRVADYSQNAVNKDKQKGNWTSRFKGVYRDKRSGKWVSSLQWRNKQYYLGSYHSEEEAAKAYDEKAKELHGSFARLNAA